MDDFGGSPIGRKQRRFARRAPAGSGAVWAAVDGRSASEIGVSVLGTAVAGSGRSGRESGVLARLALAATVRCGPLAAALISGSDRPSTVTAPAPESTAFDNALANGNAQRPPTSSNSPRAGLLTCRPGFRSGAAFSCSSCPVRPPQSWYGKRIAASCPHDALALTLSDLPRPAVVCCRLPHRLRRRQLQQPRWRCRRGRRCLCARWLRRAERRGRPWQLGHRGRRHRWRRP